jgi:hypothetical protein
MTTLRVLLELLTGRFWSRLDGFVLIALGWLLGARPHWLLTEIVCLIAFAAGVRALSAGLRRLARMPEED